MKNNNMTVVGATSRATTEAKMREKLAQALPPRPVLPVPHDRDFEVAEADDPQVREVPAGLDSYMQLLGQLSTTVANLSDRLGPVLGDEKTETREAGEGPAAAPVQVNVARSLSRRNAILAQEIARIAALIDRLQV